jgi:glycine/D-amino acid oxidase-like deaminating enzyme
VNLILGQGLAGSVLALNMLKKGERVVVIDDGYRSSSSMVAAGLWNPIVFRRINKSWLADELISTLDHFYPECEALLGGKFYHQLPIWRKHSSALEADLWEEKRDSVAYQPYLSAPQSFLPDPVFGTFPFGSALVKGAGYLDLPVFLDKVRQFLTRQGAFRQMSFELPETTAEIESLKFDGVEVGRVIDCRGYKSAASHWWEYLPFGLTKGEVLTVSCKGLPLQEIFNAGFFLQPLGKEIFRLGATFNWQDKDEIPTKEGRDFLLEKFHNHLKAVPEILSQSAGVRPTVQDRRPLMGKHPKADKLYIFNGLGTKGVMLAPYFANQFVDALPQCKALHPEVNITRFAHLIGVRHPQIDYPPKV